MLRCHLIAIVWFVVLLFNQSINQSIAQSSPVIISVTGCGDQSISTIDCDRGAELTIHGSGFLAGSANVTNPFSYLFTSITLPSGENLRCANRRPVGNDSFTICELPIKGYGIIPANQLSSISIYNKRINVTSPLFPGFAMIYEPVPIVTGVLGCQSTTLSNTLTNCDLVNDRITIVGTGFNSLRYDQLSFTLGTETRSQSMPNVVRSDFILLYNDTQMVITFSNIKYYSMLNAAAQSGISQPFYYRLSGLYRLKSEILFIQFVNLPPLVITSITVDQYNTNDPNCMTDERNGTSAFRNCTAVMSEFIVKGEYIFSGAQFTVGGQSATRLSLPYSPPEYCIRSPAYEFTKGVLYDIAVTTPFGSSIWPVPVEFNSDPIISQVMPCVLPVIGELSNGDIPVRCMPGEKLYLSVMNVAETSSPRVNISYSYEADILVCEDAVMISSSWLSCTMPTRPAFADNWWQVNVWFGDVMTREALMFPTFEPIDAPRIHSISGCYSNSGDPLHVNQCVAGSLTSNTTGIVLTLHGIRLGDDWDVSFGPYMEGVQAVRSVVVMDNQTVICTLAPFDSLLVVVDVMYALVLTTGIYGLTSNAVYVTFVDQETHDPVSNIISTLTITLTTIFSILGVCVLCIGIVMFRRFRHSKTSSSEFGNDMSLMGDHADKFSDI